MKLTVIAAIVGVAVLQLVEANDHAEILEPPVNQHVLIGDNVTMTCKTRGTLAYWVLNETALTISHQEAVDDYMENLGVLFIEDTAGGYSNLTMIAPAVELMNGTTVVCRVRDSMIRIDSSAEVKIMVYHTLRPLPPSVNIEVDCSNNHSSLPSILATLTAQHRWPEYPITNFSINITNNSNEFLLKETIFPYTADTSKSIMIDITNLLPTSFDVSDYICSTLVVSTSAVSEVYGEGEPDKHDVMIFRPLKSFPSNGLSHSAFFYPNGAFSHVVLTVQLPDVCSSQPLNYTILIEDIDTEPPNYAHKNSYAHDGPGIMSHEVYGLEGDHRYSVSIHVSSFSWTSLSDKYHFDTMLHLGFLHCTTSSVGAVSEKDDGYVYIIALGVSLLVMILALVAVVTMFLCFCMHTRRLRVHSKQQGDHPVNGSMVHNPIYDGPVYEVVTATSQEEFHAATPTGSDISPLPFHYVDEPTEALQHQGCRAVPRPTTGHTLKTGIDTEESYTVMSPAGAPYNQY